MIKDIIRKVLILKQDLNSAEQEELLAYFRDSSELSEVTSLDQISYNAGDILAGRFLSIDDTATSPEPTDTGFTGTFQSGRGETFGGVKYGIGTVLLGAIQAGFGLLGQFYAAAGSLIANANGILVTGLLYLLQFTATNAGATRTGKFGMTLLADQTTPSMQWDFESAAGATLVTNGDAETGDLTGWTDSASAWSAYSTSPYAGTYSFRHNPTVLTLPALLTQTVTGLSAGVTYNIAFASKRAFGYLTPKVYLVWQTSGHAAIRTDTVTGNAGASWQATSQSIVAPATTAEVKIELDNGGGDPFQEFLYDAITLGTSGTVVQQTATDAGWQFENPLISKELATPTAPASGYENWYADSTYNTLVSQSSAGRLAFPAVGALSHVYNVGGWAGQTVGTSVALVANGGCIAIPFHLAAAMYLASVTITNGDASSTRTWNWYLCVQNTNTGNSSENTLTVVASGTQSSFTGSGTAARTSAWAAGSQFIPPGAYWLVVQNQHATNTFALGLQSTTNTLGQTMSQTKTVTNPISGTLDFHLATWSKRTGDIPLAVIHGNVFGETSAW